MFLLAGNTGSKDRALLEASTEQGHFWKYEGGSSYLPGALLVVSRKTFSTQLGSLREERGVLGRFLRG
jgi:hypothetical protein